MAYSITLNNQTIFEYYAANPHLNIEAINLQIIGLFGQVLGEQNKVVTQNQTSEILDYVRHLKSQSEHQTQKIQALQVHGDNFALKMHETNHAFVENLKLSLANNATQDFKHMIETFVDKITVLMPQTTEPLQRSMQDFQFQLLREMDKLQQQQQHAGGQKDDLEATLTRLQQPFFQILAANNEQTQHYLGRLKSENEVTLNKLQEPLVKSLASLAEENRLTNGVLQKVNTGLEEFTGKYKTSSQFKGQCSENQLEKLLIDQFPTANIRLTRDVRASGDLIMDRFEDDKPRILFENKAYGRNVDMDEIRKFLRDVSENHCCGIMLSQTKGIVGKRDGLIEINEGNVLVYLHNVESSPIKIQMAVNAIDQLYAKLKVLSNNDDNIIVIDKDVLDAINQQFNAFMKMKETIINTAKDYNRKLVSQMDELQLPNLALFLQDKYASVTKQSAQKPKSKTKQPTLDAVVMSANIHVETPILIQKNVDIKSCVDEFISSTYGESFDRVDRLTAYIEFSTKHPMKPMISAIQFLHAVRELNIELYPLPGQKYMKRTNATKRICLDIDA